VGDISTVMIASAADAIAIHKSPWVYIGGRHWLAAAVNDVR
jgi:hypothetical protein